MIMVGFYSDFVRLFADMSKLFDILAWPFKLIGKALSWYSNKISKYVYDGELIRLGLLFLIPACLYIGLIKLKPIYWFLEYKPVTNLSILPQAILAIILVIAVIVLIMSSIVIMFGIGLDVISFMENLKPKGHSFWNDVHRYKHGKRVDFH